MYFIHIGHDGRSKNLIPHQGCDLQIKDTNLEFSYKSKTFSFEVIKLYWTLWRISIKFGTIFDIGLKFDSGPSPH